MIPPTAEAAAIVAAEATATGLALLWAVGFSLPIAFRRRWPIEALVVVTAMALWRAATGNSPEEGAMPMPSVLIGAFSAALYARPRWIAPLGVALPVLVIAGELFLSDATVKTHVTRVLSKLELRDRVQAVVVAYENGLVVPGGSNL